jgi:hypothetical protein
MISFSLLSGETIVFLFRAPAVQAFTSFVHEKKIYGVHDLHFAPILQQKEVNKKCRRLLKSLKIKTFF